MTDEEDRAHVHIGARLYVCTDHHQVIPAIDGHDASRSTESQLRLSVGRGSSGSK
jgi:hypothetical protein